MEYQRMDNKKTGELKIIVKSTEDEIFELSRCARIMVEIIEGTDSAHLRSRIHSDKLSKINAPITVRIGNTKSEIFTYSKAGIEYCFLPNRHPDNVIKAAQNHFTIIDRELADIIGYYNTPSKYQDKY